MVGTLERHGGSHPSVSKRTPSDNRDFFNEHELQELRDYIRPIRRVRRVRVALTTLIDLWVIFGLDLAPRISEAMAGQGWFIRLIVIAATLDLITVVVKAPFSYWVNLVYEKRAGHSTMTTAVWLKDQLLEFVLGLVIMALLLGPMYAAMHTFDQWWLMASVAIVAVFIAIQFVAPVWIMPRFNKFTPLEDGPIRRRIEEIAAQSGVAIGGVYLMDASKRTTRANAGVTGFGKTKRVIVNDTICHFPIEELSQVIAHELGHYRLNHIVKRFPLTALQFPLALIFIQFVGGNETVLGWAGVRELGDPASYGVLGLAFTIPMAVTGLAEKWLSRKQEREADLESLQLLGDPTAFVAVWPRMVLSDKANLEPTWWEKLNATHPEIAERMQFGLDWAAMNDVPATKPEPRPLPASATAAATGG